MSSQKKYIDVILPLPLKGVFTYFTDEYKIKIGQRVVVQFGARKLYSAVVKDIHDRDPIDYEAKPLLAILDEIPLVNTTQLKFWDWIANYYMCNLGDVMNAALPSSFKLASESKVNISVDFDGDIDNFSVQENTLLKALLLKEELSINEIAKIISTKNILSVINDLIRRDVLEIKEELYDKYREKEIRVVKFIGFDKALEDSQLTLKQEKFVLAYLKLEKKYRNKTWILSDLLKEIGLSLAILNALVKKEYFVILKEKKSRLETASCHLIEDKKLTDFQELALTQIKQIFSSKDVCLLHGVTSSGKTEIYIKLIKEQLSRGKQVLYLLPEIALTTQIVKRLRQHFGDKVGVNHSHLNNSERIEVWNAVRQKDDKQIIYPIILGARSSLFLPFDNLGLIIIDEEHDSSFKQNQPAPRYNARDAAIYLAKLHNSKVLLGSATPSVETYYNTQQKKYGLVEMHSRFEGIALPKIQVVDIRKAHLKRQMSHHFSPEMLISIKQNLDEGKQIILFQNRRGYSPLLSCDICAYTPNCKQCDVSLTYHKWNNHLKCHYCGYTESLPDACPSCNSKAFNDKGFGTEQILESLKELFPNNVSKRMDYDTTRKRNAYHNIITDFEKGRIDILVGTQMVTKGLDFENVAMVGILHADNMLHFADFRAYERAFQLMMQVSGRAGRKGKQGHVFIQTYDEGHEIFKMLKSNDFNSFFQRQLEERKLFNYPPYNRLIRITLKHKNQMILDKAVIKFAIILRKSFDDRVLGPDAPVISRIRNYYHKNFLLKISQQDSIVNAKIILESILETSQKSSDFKSIRFIIDVDPV